MVSFLVHSRVIPYLTLPISGIITPSLRAALTLFRGKIHHAVPNADRPP